MYVDCYHLSMADPMAQKPRKFRFLTCNLQKSCILFTAKWFTGQNRNLKDKPAFPLPHLLYHPYISTPVSSYLCICIFTLVSSHLYLHTCAFKPISPHLYLHTYILTSSHLYLHICIFTPAPLHLYPHICGFSANAVHRSERARNARGLLTGLVYYPTTTDLDGHFLHG